MDGRKGSLLISSGNGFIWRAVHMRECFHVLPVQLPWLFSSSLIRPLTGRLFSCLQCVYVYFVDWGKDKSENGGSWWLVRSHEPPQTFQSTEPGRGSLGSEMPSEVTCESHDGTAGHQHVWKRNHTTHPQNRAGFLADHKLHSRPNTNVVFTTQWTGLIWHGTQFISDEGSAGSQFLIYCQEILLCVPSKGWGLGNGDSKATF